MSNKKNLKNKYILELKKTKPLAKLFTFHTHMKNKLYIETFKMEELKIIAKKHGIKMGSNKRILIERILEIFNKHIAATKIQSNVRKYFAKQFVKAIGKCTENIINESDPMTLEPLSEIPKMKIIYCKINPTQCYAFNIFSLMHTFLCNQQNKNELCLQNPYTRIEFSTEFKRNLFIAYKMYKLVVNEDEDNCYRKCSMCFELCDYMEMILNPRRRNSRGNSLTTVGTSSEEATMEFIRIVENYSNLVEFRARSTMQQRVNNLFVEINNLGNYTSADWFFAIAVNEQKLKDFAIVMNIILTESITTELLISVLPLTHTSFEDTIFNGLNEFVTMDIFYDNMLRLCEELVMTSLLNETRKLGAMFILGALTFVSNEAKEQMRWLYDHYTNVIVNVNERYFNEQLRQQQNIIEMDIEF